MLRNLARASRVPSSLARQPALCYQKAANDPNGLEEFSVVYTDRALNHMSAQFCGVMTDLAGTLEETYNATDTVIIPGSGTFAMEAAARQFATCRKAMVIRNGFFSFRWSEILEMGNLAEDVTVLKAAPGDSAVDAQFFPPPVEEVCARIRAEKPDVVFAPHVETSTGMILPDSYIKAVGEATRLAGGSFVLDCIASGTVWVDMKENNVDALITAPQKGWSGPACAGIVMLSESGRQAAEKWEGTSYSCNVGKWLGIMNAYKQGGFAYYTTMPTDALMTFRNVTEEVRAFGFSEIKAAQEGLGQAARAMFESKGFKSVAAPGFQAPGVLVWHTSDPAIGGKFKNAGVQIAAGVPFKLDEHEGTTTFRIGLFGLDKLRDVPGTVARLERSVDAVLSA